MGEKRGDGREKKGLSLFSSCFSFSEKPRMQGITPGNQEMLTCQQTLCLLVLN